MLKVIQGTLLAGAVIVAIGSIASAQVTDPNAAEFKCQTSVSKAGSKFVGSKAKCAIKCQQNAAKAVEPVGDCYGPAYGGAAAVCIFDPLKGAEAKFIAAIRKACDPTFKTGTDCPECYTGGNCTQEANDRTQNIEGQVDSFGPGVFCEGGDVADKAELGCEVNTAKTLSKLVASVNKCYDKCFANARKGIGTDAACTPPTDNDPTLISCKSTADGKSIASINKKCNQVVPNANPDCGGPDMYPDGASWTNLVETAISGNVPGTYCGP